MCGIVGFTTFAIDPEAQARIDGAVRALRHRGPDGEGTFVREGIALGHTRLAIIDLEGGAQPMQSADGSLAVTFNGEIYNFRELRAELEGCGHRFRTHSDTEVLLASYREWGRECVSRLRGMFAFAIADYPRRKLFLARDHLGIKPLVYAQVGSRVAFASEIQALQTLPWVKQSLTPDPQGIYLCLRFGYAAAPHCAFTQIRKLPPAHWMEIDLDAPQCSPQRYWRLRFQPDRTVPASEWDEIIEDAVHESVKAHLVSDVPFGAFLSGGLDSTLVTAHMTELMDQPVTTFTIGFRHDAFDERRFATEAAGILGTRHYEEVVDVDSMALLPHLIRHYGEPFGDGSAVPTWHLARLARKHVPMVLSGDGGDELFAGYHTYPAWLRVLHRQRPHWKAILRPLLTLLLPHRYPPDPDPRTPGLESWLQFCGFVSRRDMDVLWRPEQPVEVEVAPHSASTAFAESADQPPVSRARSVDIETYLPSDILTKVDIAAMMHGLEVRTPLTDVRVAELIARVPPEVLIERQAGSDGDAWSGKLPIKRALEKRFRQDFVRRPKQGFGIPAEDWLLGPSGPSSSLERIRDSRSPIHRWVRPEGVARLIDQREALGLWNLLALDEWLRQNGF